MQHDAVIFDLFGTLVPQFSMAQHSELMREVSDLIGVTPAAFEEAWVAAYEERRIGAATISDQLRRICLELGCADALELRLDEVIELRNAFFRNCLSPRPGAVGLLRRLRSSGLKLGLISDTSSETLDLWPTTPFASLIDVAVFSCQAGCHKPDPKIYRAAWEPLGVDPMRCLYVGDGMSQELSGARAVGMWPVHLNVPDEVATAAEVEAWDGPAIASLDELFALALGEE